MFYDKNNSNPIIRTIMYQNYNLCILYKFGSDQLAKYVEVVAYVEYVLWELTYWGAYVLLSDWMHIISFYQV